MRDVTFEVSPKVARGKPLPAIDYRKELSSALRGPLEAMWEPRAGLVICAEEHALLSAVRDAFFLHYPLRLSPDVIWLTIARGFALHVNQNAELLRTKFVKHAGKAELVVHRPDFFPGRANPWPEVFEAFSAQVEGHVGDLCRVIRCDFSTTGPVERAVSDLMVMDAFKPYFEYVLRAGCGIPAITLLGTVKDWRSIRERAARFAGYGLEKWCAVLDAVLAQFVAAAEGRPDADFWRSFFRYNSGSGPSVMTGWITVLFPYLRDENEHLYPNPYFEDWQRRLEIDDKQDFRKRYDDPQGVGMWEYPPCMTSVPLKVFWGAAERKLKLVGGIMGVSQQSTLDLEPECGWAIVYDDLSQTN